MKTIYEDLSLHERTERELLEAEFAIKELEKEKKKAFAKGVITGGVVTIISIAIAKYIMKK